MMFANSAPLAAEEQALSNSISQLAANVFQDTQALRALDVAVQSAVVQGLTAKVQEELRHYRSLLSDLQHAAEEQETPDQTQRVANVLAKHQTEYDSIHKGFQEARISYTRRKEQSYVQQQRQELIGSVDFSQRAQQFASEQEAEQRTQDVTASLRRTRQLMAQNLEQTHGNISVIASGNKRLQAAGDELSGQKHLFKESHGLLSTLKTQSLWDRFTVWGGFAFFILVVLYISFKRTPAFMKQPLYALLHMKHGGKPFDHHDYASVNIPPGTFTPLDKPWAADEGSGSEAYPSEWSTWDAHYVEGSEHGQDVLGEGQWSAQDLLNEGLQQGSAEDPQGPPGTLRDRLRTQQEQQHVPPGKQQPWQQQQQQQQHVEQPGTPMQQQQQPFREQCAAGDQACYTASAQQQQQQQPHEDVDEVAFHSGEAFHPSIEIDADHVDVHKAFAQQDQQRPAAQQQQQQQQQHDMASPSPWPTALGIIDPDAAAAGGSAAADYAADDQHQGLREHDEVEYLQQQQQQQQDQQQQQQDHPQQQQQERVLQEQQEVDRSLQQQQQQEQQRQRLAARESAAAHVAAEAAELKAALRAQQQAPQVDSSNTATEGAAAEDQAAHAAPPGQPAATQPGPTTKGPAAEATEAVSLEEPAAPAAAQEQPPGFEPPAAADLHNPVLTGQPAAAPSREQLLEGPLGPAAQQADTVVQETLPEAAAPGPTPHADQQAAAEPQAPPPGHGEPHAAADQHPSPAEHIAADTGHVSPQQPDVVTQPDRPDLADVQQRHLSADATEHLDPEVHAGQPAATGAAEPPGSSEQQSPTATTGQPSLSEAPDEQLQAGGAAEQDRPQVHAGEQPVEQATVEAPAAAPTDAVLGVPGTPAAAAPTLVHADEQQRQLQADHKPQQLLQPPDEAVSPEHAQQSYHLGTAAQADSLDAAPAPAPAAVDGDPAHKLEQPDIEAVQLGDSHLQQQQSQEPAAAPAPVPPPASEQHADQQVEVVLPDLASTSTHAAPVAVQASGSTAPEVAAPVHVTGEVVSSAQQQQQHGVEPPQPFSTFDNEAELVHQPPTPSEHEALVDNWTGPSETVDSGSTEPTDHHRQLEGQQAEPPAAPVSDTEQPVVASAHRGDVQQGTAQAPQEEERLEYEQVQHQHQQLEDESVHFGQANEQQPELVDQAVPVSTEQQPQQQQQKASGLLQDPPAQPPAVTDQVPEHHHQQQQQAVNQQQTDAAALPKPATIVAALPVQTAAPVADAAESAQRTAATISTAAEDVVDAAVEAVSVAEQVQKAISNTGKSFGAKVLSRWGGHSGLAAIGGAKAVKQQSAGAAAVRRGGGSSFIPAAAAAEIPPPARPQEEPATYAGSGLDYYADDMSLEQQAVEADTGAAPATGSKETTQQPHSINPDSLSAAELDQLSKQIEEEQQKAFTIMDMDDVGLYRYDEQGNAVLRDGLSSAARQSGGSSGSGAASEHVEL